MKTNQKEAFTLVEIMIVVAIIGLLAAIAIPNFVRATNESKQRACITNLQKIEQVKTAFLAGQQSVADHPLLMEELFPEPNNRPVCPSGGTYVPGTKTKVATCSYTATGASPYYPHVLPPLSLQ